MANCEKPINKLSVIIPVYNEVQTIAEIVKKVKAVDMGKEIIIVDDCSTDGIRGRDSFSRCGSGIRSGIICRLDKNDRDRRCGYCIWVEAFRRKTSACFYVLAFGRESSLELHNQHPF